MCLISRSESQVLEQLDVVIVVGDGPVQRFYARRMPHPSKGAKPH